MPSRVNIKSGGTNWLQYATNIRNLFSTRVGNNDIELNLPEVVDLGELPNCRNADGFFSCYIGSYRNYNPKTIKFKFNPELAIVVTNMFYRANFIEKIIFDGGIKIADYSYYMFSGNGNLKIIEGEFDLSSYQHNNGYPLLHSTLSKLEEIRFKQETINFSFPIVAPKLSIDSINSIINGLATVTASATLTLSVSLENPLTAEQEQAIANKGWTLAYA